VLKNNLTRQNQMCVATRQINFSTLPIDKEWAFSDKTIKDTSYITHGYYTYPAKFIPQLAAKLIQDYSSENDIVCDPFMGSGTTIVEALVNKRIGIGTDINPIAYLVAKVKTTVIQPDSLVQELNKIGVDIFSRVNGSFAYHLEKAKEFVPQNERIDYWFKQPQKEKLSILLHRLKQIENQDIQDFFLVAFAQILKTCSIWLQKSVKPTRDLNKQETDPIDAFVRQSKKMLKKYIEFNYLLNPTVRENIAYYRTVKHMDSRQQPIEDERVSLVVTSPPYVTSYEYADLHQLPSLWLEYMNELSEFRKPFIGSAYKTRDSFDLKSKLASEIIAKLGNTKKATEVATYFSDMLETFYEMKRALKKGGKACIVIGNTQLRGVSILNAEVFQEQMHNVGFVTHKIIHREIPSKMLPSTRDAETGKFTKTSSETKKFAYPTEYILIMEKL
jgi:DNA modification methylase